MAEDRRVVAEPPHELDLVAAAHGADDQFGARCFGNLAELAPNPARSAMNQYRLARPHPSDRPEDEPGGGGVGWDGSRGLEAECVGDRSNEASDCDGDLRVASSVDDRERSNGLAASQTVDARANGADPAGDLDARNERELYGHETSPKQGLGVADARVGDVYRHLPGCRRWLGKIDQTQHLRPPERCNRRRLQSALLLGCSCMPILCSVISGLLSAVSRGQLYS